MLAEIERPDDAFPRLYAVYLGGDPAPGRLGEDHEVVFVVTSDPRAARRAARAKWSGSDPKPHVDMVQELDAVDGYEVALTQTGRASANPPEPTYEPTPPDDAL
ncbi:MAG TPA: DUF1543 domain-containing protein [Acidimicrobiales bacterium]|nr:DUF1543 domain-containing protein [Acidimicrobiales bacterium]